MQIRYFPDTDTAYLQFTDRPVAETRDLTEDVVVDLDEDGNLVAMTIEHANAKAGMAEVSYRHVSAEPA